MIKFNLIASGVFALFAGWILWESSKFPPPGPWQGDPAAFPTFLGWVILLLAIALAAEALIGRWRGLRIMYEESPIDPFSHGMFKVYCLCVLFVVFGFVTHYAGFYAGACTFLPLTMYALGERRWLPIIIITVSFPIFVYIVFTRLLGIVMP